MSYTCPSVPARGEEGLILSLPAELPILIPFPTSSELENPSYDVPETHKNCRSADFEALKL